MDIPPAGQLRIERLFSLSRLADARLPVVVAVPHAGRDYPCEVLANARVEPGALERLEDRHADMLAAQLADAGCVTLVAHAARAWIDLNRAPGELDPQMIADVPRSAFGQPSAKVRGGLGLVPRRLADHGELWIRPWTRESIGARIALLHTPYHQALANTLASLQSRFGCALLIDLHSMPPLRQETTEPPPRFVIGDRFGRSADGRLCDLAMRTLTQAGYSVALNHPYAGGYVLERHGRPLRNTHALQLEVDRSLYLDEALDMPGRGLNVVRDLVRDLVLTLADDLQSDRHGGDIAVAAE